MLFEASLSLKQPDFLGGILLLSCPGRIPKQEIINAIRVFVGKRSMVWVFEALDGFTYIVKGVEARDKASSKRTENMEAQAKEQ